MNESEEILAMPGVTVTPIGVEVNTAKWPTFWTNLIMHYTPVYAKRNQPSRPWLHLREVLSKIPEDFGCTARWTKDYELVLTFDSIGALTLALLKIAPSD